VKHVCANCLFAKAPPNDLPPWRIVYAGALECHRYPPVVAGHTLASDNNVRLVPAMMFAQVDPTDWCAEFQQARGRNR